MKIKLRHAPYVIRGFLWVLLGASFVLILTGYNYWGMAGAAISLVLNRLLRRVDVRVWLFSRLTGTPRDVVLTAVDPAAAPRAPKPQMAAGDLPKAEIDRLLKAHMRPGILLKRHWPLDMPAPQNSWLGGRPRLAQDMAWPVDPNTGLALHHLAQIDLSEMPRPDTGPQLPLTGTLNFFADIGEDMSWEEGPGTRHSRVIYTSGDTSARPLAPVPDTLPEIDHADGKMTGTLWGHRPPKFHVYPRWPVTGHIVPTWDQAILPDGVDYTSGYLEAMGARMDAARTALVGPKPDRQAVDLLSRAHRHKDPATGEITVTPGVYQPEIFGPRFPVTHGIGHEYLRDMLHEIDCDLRQADMQIYYAQQRGDTPRSDTLEAQQLLSGLRPRVMQVLSVFAKADKAAPVAAAAQGAFDDLMSGLAQNPKTARYITHPGNAIIRVLAQSFDDPDLIASVPQSMMDAVADTVMPAHHYTNHYLLGAKGVASNPTQGYGIRLLQIDSDYALEMMFCDVGIIDFWIDPEDLSAGRWDRAWAATAGG